MSHDPPPAPHRDRVPGVEMSEKQNPFGTTSARLMCQGCGFPLGKLSADRRRFTATFGLVMVTDLELGRTEVVCPRCTLRRILTKVVFTSLAVPKTTT